MKGVVYVNEKLYAANPTWGRPDIPLITDQELQCHLDGVSNIFVHGYNWEADELDNAQVASFPVWQEWIPDEEKAVGLSWDSNIGLIESWCEGHLNPYHAAWARAADDVADALIRVMEACDSGANIVCHSLGSRVVSQALLHCRPADEPKTVLVLNGAESSDMMLEAVKACPETQFYFVGSKNDRVLRYLGALFTPGAFYEHVVGLHGLPLRCSNATEIWLDKDRWQAWAETMGFQLDGSGFIGTNGHFHSIADSDNWPLYERILRGESVGG